MRSRGDLIWEESAIALGEKHNIPDRAHHPKIGGRIGKVSI
ncbi:MAG: hypothetical protein RIG27_04995 [Coleofasciculus sp. F4-SAH-05]